ncbi:MAG: glycosyltransferase [Chloroflexi bacterium]|nr:glycosyltransferase [Chloroflexota bacterium]
MERDRQPHVAYLIKCFPRLSETFILHEVLELERQELSLRIFSILPPTGKVNQAAREVRAPVTYFPNGFPAGWIILIAAALRRLLKSPGTFLRVSLEAIVRFHHIATPRHILYAAYLAEQLEREGITHLHAHYANTPTTVALLAHQFTGIPFSFTAHAKDIYLSPRDTLAYKMKQARLVVTCTDYNRQYLTSLLGRDDTASIHRIYHGLDLRHFPAPATASPVPSARPLILSVARLVEKKGLVYLLQACRSLIDRGYDLDCRIIGDGPLRATLEQQIHDLALGDRVELCGAETHERVIQMYRQATLFALPSIVAENGDRDGIPNVLVESLYMGVPVVSTPVSGIPELIQPGHNGLLVPPGDSRALAEAVAQLLDSPRLRERLAAAGRETVLAEFDTSVNAQRLLALFLNLEPAPSRTNRIATFSHPPANLGGVHLSRNATRKVG